MKTKWRWGWGITVTLWVLTGFQSSLVAQEARKPDSKSPLRLALLEWPRATNALERNTRGILMDLVTAQLTSTPELELVERSAVESILQELTLSMSGRTRPEEAVRVGHMLKANWLLLLMYPEGTTIAVMSKILDASTGAILDLQMVPLKRDDPSAAASMIAACAVAVRNPKATMKDRLWIGFGGFEDLGLHQRYKNFGEQLRTAMSLKYAGTRVSVVERSHVRPLMEELQLSMNGFTAERAGSNSAQHAFVLVDGVYQAFQDERSKINLVLRMEWISGRQSSISIKETPGADVERKVGEAVDRFLVEARNSVVTNSPIRRTELQAQLRRGRELARISPGYHVPMDGFLVLDMSVQDRGQRTREAISAFESALFLDPENLEARFGLAACLVDPELGRIEEARDIWRDIAAISTKQKAQTAARSALAASYVERDNEQAHELLMSLRNSTTNLEERVQINSRLKLVRIRLGNQGKLAAADIIEFATEAWRSSCQLTDMRLVASGKIMNEQQVFWNPGSDFSTAFTGPNNQEARLEHVGNVVSNLALKFPRLEPYLVANHAMRPGVSPYWSNRYKEVLARFDKDPESVSDPRTFAGKLTGTIGTLLGRKDYEWAHEVGRIFERHNEKYLGIQMEKDEGNFLIGRLYVSQGRWAEAIAVFERIGQRQIMWSPTEAFWGKASSMSGVRAAEICRQQMALQNSPSKSAGTLTLKPVRVFPGSNIVFAVDGQQMLLSDRSNFHRYDLPTDSLKTLSLPVNMRVRSIVNHQGKIWFATADGLYGWNPTDNSVMTNGVEQGLLMPGVTAMEPDKDRLWIGFGKTTNGTSVGGLGYLKFPENRFVGMMSELSDSLPPARGGGRNWSAPSTGAQGRYVTGMAKSSADSLWVTSSGRLFRYQISNGTWEAAIPLMSASIVGGMAATGDYVVVSCYEPNGGSSMDTNRGGVFIYDIQKKTHRRLTMNDGLPNNDLYSVLIDGANAWVGGRGFVSLLDLPSARIEKTGRFASQHSGTSVALQGNNLWFSSGPALYQLPKDGHLDATQIASRKNWLGDDAAEVGDIQSARAISRKMEEVYRVYKTRESEDYLALQAKLRSFLRRSAKEFPLVESSGKTGTNRFMELVLNKDGRGFDGFRFKCTLREPADFGWIFAYEFSSPFDRWRMLPMEEAPWVGFTDFNRPKVAYTNAPWSGLRETFTPILQFSHDGQLEPGKEYFVWMDFKDSRPARVFVAFDFFPASARYLSRTVLEGAFGLSGPIDRNSY